MIAYRSPQTGCQPTYPTSSTDPARQVAAHYGKMAHSVRGPKHIVKRGKTPVLKSRRSSATTQSAVSRMEECARGLCRSRSRAPPRRHGRSAVFAIDRVRVIAVARHWRCCRTAHGWRASSTAATIPPPPPLPLSHSSCPSGCIELDLRRRAFQNRIRIAKFTAREAPEPFK